MSQAVQPQGALDQAPAENPGTPYIVSSRFAATMRAAGLDSEAITHLMARAARQAYRPGDTIVAEGDHNSLLYFIETGSVSVRRSVVEAAGQSIELGRIPCGEMFGEMSVVRADRVSASVVALEHTEVIAVPIDEMKRRPDLVAARAAITEMIARKLADRLTSTNDRVVEELRRQVGSLRLNLSASVFLTRVFIGISLYVLLLSYVSKLKVQLPSDSIISILVISAFTIVIYLAIRHGAFSFRDYGVGWDDWRRNAVEGAKLSVPIMLALLAGKYIYVNSFAPDTHVFEPFRVFAREDLFEWQTYALLLFAYAVFSIAQEFVARCGIQGSLEKLYAHDGAQPKWRPILVSNVLFSAMHSHLSLLFAAIVFLPGVFWGWMYHRQHSLVGVSVSHILIGAWAVFILGFPY